jgi:hypothetical protein
LSGCKREILSGGYQFRKIDPFFLIKFRKPEIIEFRTDVAQQMCEFCVVVAWLLVMVVAGIGIWGKGLGWELRRLVFGLGVDLLRVAEFVLFSPLGNP